jgi:hypothetical protein
LKRPHILERCKVHKARQATSVWEDNGELTESKEGQARELLATFFPPLPPQVDEEEEQLQKPPLPFVELQQHEIRAKIYEAGQWKELWPTVKDDVTDLFRSSIKDVPLRKPGKEDYAIAKAWRPISLLSTLGKALEAVIAERISFLAEEHGLLPQNHFGARRRRSAEQALLLLQSKIADAWRSKRVLSLISFDVKGASHTSIAIYSEGDVTRVYWRLSIPVEQAAQGQFTSRSQVGPLETTHTFTGTVDVRYTAMVPNHGQRTTLISELKTPGVIRADHWQNPNNTSGLKSRLGQEMRW